EGGDGVVRGALPGVDLDPRLRGDGLRDVGRRHGAEELALLAGPGADPERPSGDQLGGERFVLALLPGQTRRVALLEDLRMLQGALLRPDRPAPRDQVVARVPVG